jgi:gluconolactonase
MAIPEPSFEIVARGLDFPEGPVAQADGSLLVVEIGGRALTRVEPDGSVERLARLDGGPNGAAMGPDGWVYICNSGGWLHTDVELDDGRVVRRTVGQSATPGWIERVRVCDGHVEKLHEACDGVALQAPNDLVFDASGGYYFTDHGKRSDSALGLGAVFYGHADGRPLVKVVGPLVTPNGVALSPDGRSLYVAETLTRRVLAFDIVAPGCVVQQPWPGPAGGRLLIALPGFNGLDSMAVDAQGWINVCSLVNGGIWSISPDGAVSRHTAIDDPFTTNLCFGGTDRKTVFVTLSATGCLGSMPWPVAGLPLHFN